MSARFYFNFDLILGDVKLAGGRVSQFSAQVFDSPAGAAPVPDVVTVPDGLETLIDRLRNRDLDADRPEQARLGLSLADLLLPDAPGQTSTRDLFHESLAWLRDGEGLRLRVRAPAELAGFPWEFASFPRQAQGTREPLLADRRVSLVRHEAMALPAGRADDHKAPASRRVVYATASPEPFNRYPPLTALPQERNAVRKALTQPGVDLVTLPASDDSVTGATLDQLIAALGEATHVLHFSGHGEFAGKGGGSIVLADGANRAIRVSAEKLGELLRGLGVRLVVLGACHTANRDVRNPWGGVASALLRAGVPAVVAMQDAVRDVLTAAFCAAFYKAVVVGRLVDEAVTAGRIAMRGAALEFDSPDVRDWASPVLYLRSTGAVFRPVSDSAVSGHAATELDRQVTQTLEAVAKEGRVVGAIGESGVKVTQKIAGEVGGLVIGGLAVKREGGRVVIEQSVGTVTGTLIGMAQGSGAADDPVELLRKHLLVPPPKERKKPRREGS